MIIQLKEYKVTIKDEITWGDSEAIQATIQKGAKIKGTATEQNFEYDTSVMLEAKYVTLEKTITKIEKGDEVVSFSREWMNNLSIVDGNKLYDAVNQLTKKE
jgi:hypothetical protein